LTLIANFFDIRHCLLAVVLVCACVAQSHAQRLRFPDAFQDQFGGIGQTGSVALPQNGLSAAAQSIPQLPNLTLPSLTAPNFDPGFLPQGVPTGNLIPNQLSFPQGVFPGTQPQNFGAIPTLDLPRSSQAFSQLGFPQRDPSNYQLQPFPIFPNPANLRTPQLQPPVRPPQNILPQFQPNLPNTGLGQQQFNFGTNPGAFQSRFPYQGLTGNFLPAVDWTWPRQQWQRFQNDFLPRVLEHPRLRQTYLHGSNRGANPGNELDINDIEVATTLTIPNFLQSRQPLRISPGFVASFWDGPDTPSTGFDLPSRAFGAYLAADHVTDLARTSGLETNFTVGVYSDYDNFSSDAIRLQGRILGWQRINEYTVGKLGIEYLDRVKVKLLPAVGLFLSPNPDIKLDLYFPRTKLAHRIPNVGNYEMWSYVGAEYGGGSWAIERIDGSDDQVDINDVRAFIGVEWIGPRRVTGFFDFGYAFERELVYASDRRNNLELQDTLMIRSGIAF